MSTQWLLQQRHCNCHRDKERNHLEETETNVLKIITQTLGDVAGQAHACGCVLLFWRADSSVLEDET